jgi:hypothetical protein
MTQSETSPRIDFQVKEGQFPTLPPTSPLLSSSNQPKSTGDILRDMAATFDERNKVYGSNYLMVSKMVKVLFPDGVPPGLVETDHWHLFELKLVKLSRFAISNLSHMDSIHDDGVYSAMIESILHRDSLVKK